MISFAKGAAFLGFQNIVEHSEASQELHQKFQQHMVAEGLSYGTREEYEFRFEIFRKKDKEVDFWNKIQSSFELGHNMFSTMTEEEAARWMGDAPVDDSDIEPVTFDETNLAASKDWRANGSVTAVKNQGGCGSCWAFAATQAVESNHHIKNGKLYNLAEQQLVSCDTKSYGCNGGYHMYAYDYLKVTPQVLQGNYPYTAKTGTCDKNKEKGGVVYTTGKSLITRGSVSAHKAALGKGVLSISLAASSSVFQLYKSGILDSTSCGTSTNHAVGMVGYGTSNGVDYWIVRNSWGTGWGDAGYIKIAAYDGAGICGCQNRTYLPAMK